MEDSRTAAQCVEQHLLVAHVALHELDPRIQVGRRLSATVDRLFQAVENAHCVAVGEQRVGGVRTDEPRASSD